ncbi:MAG: radical SAM protein [Candidatus Bathyarchaeum sp.]|nr:MAG: radical SAM protein [Candidatus Bathyarchaeum sp.]
MTDACFPEKVRVSIGSAIVMGLLKGKLDAEPTTAYLLMCRKQKCAANCGFCPQSRSSKGRADRLSRVTWPEFFTTNVVERIENAVNNGSIKRVCIQLLNYPEAFDDVLCFVKEVKARVEVPISVSCRPLTRQQMKKWAESGINRISVALDAATEQIFSEVKGQTAGGPYSWQNQHKALKEAVEVFGRGSVSTHLIVGLGETEKELCRVIQWCIDSGVYPGIFAFTPIKGTALEGKEPPQVCSYRRVQVAHYLLTRKETCLENMEFDDKGRITNFGVSEERLQEVIESGKPFLTSGCPGCNRPYYNERPGGVIYNYPRQLTSEETKEAKRVLGF